MDRYLVEPNMGVHIPKTVSGGILWGTDVHVFSVCFDVSIPGIDYLS